MEAWRADPLVWGHGPRIFEVFLEPTCPFSVKALGKLEDLLDQAGEDRITVKLGGRPPPASASTKNLILVNALLGVPRGRTRYNSRQSRKVKSPVVDPPNTHDHW